MEITKALIEPNVYSRPQVPLKKVSKIAVHYVGNAGTTAMANRNYFDGLKNTHAAYASSHYIVGLYGEIIQCIPENEISYATNDANSYSISIENCHPYADGKFTEATRKSLKELCADICKRYGLDPMNDIIRHYDVTGKRCPLYWVTHPEDFLKFKNEVAAYIAGEDKDMVKLEELQKRVETLENNKEKKYSSAGELPEWGKPTVEKLIKIGYLKGTDTGIDITDTMLRLLVINDRAGLYDTK